MIRTSLIASPYLAILLCILAAGCTNPPQRAPQLPLSRDTPIPPSEIIELLQNNHRTLYSSRRGEYSYYISGALNAVYQIQQDQLVITAETANKPKVCTYDHRGVLQQKSSNAPNEQQRDDPTCDILLKTLAQSLSAAP